MFRLLTYAVLVSTLFGVGAPAAIAHAASPSPGACALGLLPHGALSLICVPKSGWNGDLVVYAHGFVPTTQPLGFANLTLPDGTSLPSVVEALGYAFATTTYRRNGLVILSGMNDIRALVARFRSTVGAPRHTFMVGVSEGGLVATLLAERAPQLFSGALAACGPIGSFRGEVNTIGDFRVLFDYFFPGVIPGTAVFIPPQVIANWSSVYVPAIARALVAHPAAVRQLLATSHAVFDPKNPATALSTVLQLLSYDVITTDNARHVLGGNPFGNRRRWYFGSSNDLLLNLRVQRFSASPEALAHLHRYETTGHLTIPLVTLHTVGDPLVPIWQEVLYARKVHVQGRGRVTQLPVFAYGHCNFTASDVLVAFGLLAVEVSAPTK